MLLRTSRHARYLTGAILWAGSLLELSHAAEDLRRPLAATPAGRPLILVFSDDFETFRRWNGRDGVWRTVYGNGSNDALPHRTIANNGELQIYADSDMRDAQGALGLDPFSAHDGILEIIATPAAPRLYARIGNYRYISGLITSQPSFAQTYGYFEMRAKLPAGKGLWPAFWLLPSDFSWPPEVDVMESIGDSAHIYMTAHSATRTPVAIEARISADAYHIFAVSWDVKELIWYVDGKEAGRQATPADMRKPMFMLANLAVGGNWPGLPDGTTRFPAKMTIDYIRAYRFAS